MRIIAIYIILSIFILAGMLLLLFIAYSFLEKEQRAIQHSLVVLPFYISILFLLQFIPTNADYLLAVILLIGLVLILIKFGNKKIEFAIPQNHFDERDVMFSRDALKKGTENFDSYYKYRRENKIVDDKFRKEPGLLAKGATFYNELLFSAADATFKTVNLLQPLVEQTTELTKTNHSGKELSKFIKYWTTKLGASDVGFTQIKPHHIYTHIGRGVDYGKKVELSHKYAIAFTVEMSHNSMAYNPRGPVVMESSQQYLNAGTIAIQLAQFLRNLGFEARAHIDANYRLICPIVAQDAGLGTIGRMGLLMTPKLGPRVRIGVVSTDLELAINKNSIDYSQIHFCEACKKCSTNCPSQAIPNESITKTDKPKRWQINQEKCFTYWCKVGTDCARCMAVCPYSHPNNLIHNFMRWMIKRNPVNRWVAIKLDDYFYGKKPQSKKLKNWMQPRKG